MNKATSSVFTTSQGHRKRAVFGGGREKGKRAYLEALESRHLLSVTLTFGGAGTALTLAESSPGASNVKISEASPNVLRIDLNGDNFNIASSAAAGLLTYNGGTPGASTFADIDISGANAITNLNATLTGDLVSIGTINDTNGGVDSLNITGNLIEVLGASTVNTSAVTSGTGNILLTAASNLDVQTGATLQTKNGSIILQGDLGGNTGNFDGIDVTGATIKTTGTGGISLQGMGSTDASTGNHIGVNISSGAGANAVLTATGTGNMTIVGTGGTGTTGNAGVNVGGATINAVGPVTISGTGGQGTDSDIGVNINGLSSAEVTTPGLLQITGTGGGTGSATNEIGVQISNSALVLATGTGSVAITGTAGTASSTGLNITTASNVLASNGTMTLTADSMLLSPTPTISGNIVVIQPLTAGTQIDIGGTSSAGVLGLSTLSVDGILGGTLQIGNATAGAMVVSGTINSPSLQAMKLVNNGAITETGSITTAALAIHSAGPVTLGGGNSIHVLAASVTGALTFNNVGALTVGTADGEAGVSTGGNLVLTTTGLLTIGSGAGETIHTTGLVDISSPGMSEGTGSSVTATSLELRGTGSFVLTGANAVGTLAANVAGAIQFANTGNLVVGTAGVTSGIQSTTSVTLAATGAISSPGLPAGVTAHTLAVTSATNLGTAGVPFTTAVPTFAATVSGGVSITNTGNLVVGTVGSLNGITAASDVSIGASGTLSVAQQITTGGNVVVSGSGTIGVSAAINALSATVLGSTGNDTITISTTGSVAMSVDGRGGTDTYTINFGQLQSAVNVAPSSGTNTLIANGTAAGNTFGIGSGIIVWNGAEFVFFSNVPQVSLVGGAGNDVFNVTPTAATAITVDGGLPTPPATPGDFLNLQFAGTANVVSTDAVNANGHTGSFAFSNRQTVSYSDLEFVPVLQLSGGSANAIRVVEGTSTGTVALASFADPEANLPVSDYSATVNWGDGSAPEHPTTITFDATTQAYTLTGTHTYTEPGVFRPSILINSTSGLSSSTILETALVSAIPIVGKGTALTGTEGKTISGSVATFTTTRNAAAAADYTASINWGDGTASAGTVVKDSTGHFHVNGSHAYGDQSTGTGFHVTVTISRTGASDTVVGSTAKMAGVPIDTPSSRSNVASVNVSKTFVLATFRDQNPVNTNAGAYVATITWGDGTTSLATFVRLSSTAKGSIWQVRAAHKYTSKKTFKPVIRIHDVANPKQVLTINDTIAVS